MPSTSYAVLSLGKPPVRRSDAASTANGSRSSVRGPCRVLAESASRSTPTARKRHQNKHNATPGGLLTDTALGGGQRAGGQGQPPYPAPSGRRCPGTRSV